MNASHTRYLTLAFLLVLLLNIPVLLQMKFSGSKSKAPVIDPSGYYGLTHQEDKPADENAEEKKSSVFMANFFGLPAILLTLGLMIGFSKSGHNLPVFKKFILLTLSWILFEAVAYCVLIFSAFTMSIGIIVLPILGAISMFLFLWLVRYFYDFKWSKSPVLFALITLLALILPLIQFFAAYQAAVAATLSILIWQGIFLWAVSDSVKSEMQVVSLD